MTNYNDLLKVLEIMETELRYEYKEYLDKGLYFKLIALSSSLSDMLYRARMAGFAKGVMEGIKVAKKAINLLKEHNENKH